MMRPFAKMYSSLCQRLGTSTILAGQRRFAKRRVIVIPLIIIVAPLYALAKVDAQVVGNQPIEILEETQQLQLSSAKCWDSPWPGCALADMFLGDFKERQTISLRNNGDKDMAVVDADILLRGQYTESQLTKEELQLFWPEGKTLRAHRTTDLRVALPLDHALSADRYTGNIYLTLENENAVVTIPADVTIRTSVTWVILGLLFGMAAGLLLRYVDEHGEASTPGEMVFGKDTFKHPVRLAAKGVLLLIALFIGLETFYVQPGASLGTQPLTDFLSLVLWGFGADVTSRTVVNLRKGR